MEKRPAFGFNWQSASSVAQPELNSSAAAGGQLPPQLQQQQCFFGLSWEHPMNQDAHFESALSSLVSSPTSNPPASANDSIAIGELIGRLGSICNSGDVSPASRYQSASNSCYSTPRNSPPKLNLSVIEQGRGLMPMSANQMSVSGPHVAPFPADPGLAERASRFSCFNGRSYSGLAGQFGLPEAGKLSRVSSSQSLKVAAAGSSQPRASSGDGRQMTLLDPAQLEMEMRSKLGSRMSASSTLEDAELNTGQEASSVSDRMVAASKGASLRGHTENNGRKRKTAPKSKAKEASSSSSSAINQAKTPEQEDSDMKRSKTTETEKDAAVKPKTEQCGDSSHKQGNDNNANPPEPLKDYIHVRARRGQATDSHSLAERVRREKISERMKFLQELVPGCNKVTGKAVMLDEIINYVQSLQRQVEFLSMKLATVNPQLDFNMGSLVPKDMNEGHAPLEHPVFPMETTSMPFSYPSQAQVNALPNAVTAGFEMQCSSAQLYSLQRSLSMQFPSLDGFNDVASQLGNYWEDDLHSVVQMGFEQSHQEAAFSSQSIHSQDPASHMKIEL